VSQTIRNAILEVHQHNPALTGIADSAVHIALNKLVKEIQPVD
jgi:hypothetical protein